MADKVEKVAGALVHAGVRRIPVLAFIEDAVKPLLPAGADERLRAALEAEAREDVVRLQQRVQALEAQLQSQGKQLDDLGMKRTVAVAREVAEGVAAAYGEPKVDAVLNAGARQFDPRMGRQESRKYWLDRALNLTDMESRALLLLKDHQPVIYLAEADEMFWGDQREPANLSDEDRVALGTVLDQLVSRGDLVNMTSTTATIRRESVTSIVLSGQGKILVRFIEPIPST